VVHEHKPPQSLAFATPLGPSIEPLRLKERGSGCWSRRNDGVQEQRWPPRRMNGARLLAKGCEVRWRKRPAGGWNSATTPTARAVLAVLCRWAAPKSWSAADVAPLLQAPPAESMAASGGLERLRSGLPAARALLDPYGPTCLDSSV